MKTNKKTIFTLSIFIYLLIFSYSCSDYLDVVPDNVPTVDHAFNNRAEAERYLYGCYSFLPSHADINSNPALTAGDEVWLIDYIASIGEPIHWKIAKGEQGTDSPFANYWSSRHDAIGANGGTNMFTGIRDCNIFIENISKPFDLQEWERQQWIAEVNFLKAYMHFWLLRMYGPIPLIKENLPISASPEDVMTYREPVDDVVEYIVELLDNCAEDLPMEHIPTDIGRATKQMAIALKAQVLTLAASPLFNGNPDYIDVTDNRGVKLFPQQFETVKWQKAADALKEAIDISLEAGHQLYDFNTSMFASNISEQTILAMQVRGAVTERWNKEIIWGDSRSNPQNLQRMCNPGFFPPHQYGGVYPSYAPPLRVVEQFYSSNGVPIDEDKEWVDVDRFGFRKGDEGHKYYIKRDYTTINLHFNREPRFYGSISFDGSLFYGNGRVGRDDNLLHTNFLLGGGGVTTIDRYSSTGYLVKKLINLLTAIPDNSDSFSGYRYAFPVIRLADLYLMYAEALNEVKSSPDAEVYEYIDYVRKRSGLEGVVESWSKYSTFPEKPLTKEGMREIIQRERLNELAFEGARFWDLRRWKLSEQYLNQNIEGWDVFAAETAEFYKLKTVYELKFEKKDYLWPISQSQLTRNKNLVQNPGW